MTNTLTTTVGTAISSRLEARFASELAGLADVSLVRRCADVEELLTAAESGAVTVAAVSPDFPGMNGSVVAELTLRGATVLGVTSATSPLDERQCEAWGLTQTHVVGSGLLQSTLEALVMSAQPPAQVESPPPDDAEVVPDPGEAPTSTVVLVWGPPGAPGRTTTATHLSRELGRHGTCLLVDADTVAPSCAAHLGLLDEASGVLAAARLVDAGTLNLHQLQSIAAHVDDGFDVLSGVGTPQRWHELTRFHIARIVELARTHYRWIVIDICADLSADEGMMFDTIAPARNGAALEALDQADTVLALAAADPISLQRFARSGPDLIAEHADVRVVVTKARDAAVGGSAEGVVSAALERFVGVRPVAILPDAREALDAALLRGALVDGSTRSGAEFVSAVRGVVAGLGVETGSEPARARRWSLGRRRSA